MKKVKEIRRRRGIDPRVRAKSRTRDSGTTRLFQIYRQAPKDCKHHPAWVNQKEFHPNMTLTPPISRTQWKQLITWTICTLRSKAAANQWIYRVGRKWRQTANWAKRICLSVHKASIITHSSNLAQREAIWSPLSQSQSKIMESTGTRPCNIEVAVTPINYSKEDAVI